MESILLQATNKLARTSWQCLARNAILNLNGVTARTDTSARQDTSLSTNRRYRRKLPSPFVSSRLLRLRHEWTHKTQWFGAHPRLQQTLSRRTIAVLLFALLRGTTIHHKVGAAVLIHATTEECNEQLSSPISSVLYVKGWAKGLGARYGMLFVCKSQPSKCAASSCCVCQMGHNVIFFGGSLWSNPLCVCVERLAQSKSTIKMVNHFSAGTMEWNGLWNYGVCCNKNREKVVCTSPLTEWEGKKFGNYSHPPVWFRFQSCIMIRIWDKTCIKIFIFKTKGMMLNNLGAQFPYIIILSLHQPATFSFNNSNSLRQEPMRRGFPPLFDGRNSYVSTF